MAFWYRIGQSKLKILSTQFRRCYIQLSHAPSFNSTRLQLHQNPRVTQMPYWAYHNRLTDVCNNVRFFAAPVQVKPNKEEETSGPRLNDEIKAQFVRLVMDDGHSIVSRREALEHARKLKLDLVEVQKNTNPPVCKIMDFHKEMFKRQEKEKERAKSKSEVTLRKGAPKEVRCSGKTELKDLKVKADMIKKLMEKGYRVKCRVVGNEDQDLMGLLSDLAALIEDVSLVESGPHLSKKEVYMIVRHAKFGPSKKGVGGKKFLDATQMAVETKEANFSDFIEDQNQSSAESGSETEEEELFDGEHVSLSMGTSDKIIKENRYRRTDPLSENRVPSSAQSPPYVAENRYTRTEPRNRFQQTSLGNRGQNEKGPGIRDSVRLGPSILNQQRETKVEGIKQAVTSGSRNSTPVLEDNPKHGMSQPSAPNAPRPRPGYGVFSAPKGPETQGNTRSSTQQHFSTGVSATFRKNVP